jgi:hypothetical protein
MYANITFMRSNVFSGKAWQEPFIEPICRGHGRNRGRVTRINIENITSRRVGTRLGLLQLVYACFETERHSTFSSRTPEA